MRLYHIGSDLAKMRPAIEGLPARASLPSNGALKSLTISQAVCHWTCSNDAYALRPAASSARPAEKLLGKCLRT
jgi:hypothetical protein